jgi:3-oxoacyl-(acyl-carrier-protein) synthase
VNPPAVITGLGCLGAPGRGIGAQLAALRAGTCGLATFDDPVLPLAARLPVGRVTGSLPDLPRTAALGAVAAEEALADLPADLRRDTGLIVGTATAGMAESERAYLADGQAAPANAFRHHPAAAVTALLREATGCRGPSATHSSACASSACALIEALVWLRTGRCRRVLVVGADANTRLTMSGFLALEVVDPAGCRPLIEERAGMSLGEAGAALLLETPAAATERAATPLALAEGWGLRADAHHVTAPHPAGVQLQAALREALADAGLTPADIGYVNAHGTGTRDNDASECAALTAVLGAVPVASSKRVYGHTMGAAGAVEAIATVLALCVQERFVSAGAEDGTPLPGVTVQRTTAAATLRHAISTSLAFGGVNAALVLGVPA